MGKCVSKLLWRSPFGIVFRHDTAPGERLDRPLFLDYFDKKEQEKKARSKGLKGNSPVDQMVTQQYMGTGRPIVTQQHPTSQTTQLSLDEKHILQQQQHLQQQQAQSNLQQQQQQVNLQQQQHHQVQLRNQEYEKQHTTDNTMVYPPTALIHSQPKPMSAEERRKFEHADMEEKNVSTVVHLYICLECLKEGVYF
ncbi:SWI/SNF chromatin-remodeling complex subunit SNF5-like [Homarus americanus]|uniref:SWI/SNF chromatin-remodeling complex subunit SNF5-like n=1 Tax=Homarus americanus TaxID=6706 RepID=UPI001C45CD21|nr:SWI/SNF chromatin-remodeling complex subunit SNF5-like [Homarus americanus]